MARRRRGDTDREIAGLARRQHGVVSRQQLLEAGVPSHAIDGRLREGLIQPLYRGVYGVGPIAAPHGREMAAVLAADGSSVISHGSAAALWQFMPPRPATEPVRVIVAHGSRGRRPGIRVHRVRTLRPDEVTKLEGIPVTTPARTLLDVGTTMGGRELERAFAEAFARGLTTHRKMVRFLERYAGRRGSAALRVLLDSGTPARTRSEGEEQFLALLRKVHLPMPEVNATVGRYQVDFYWRMQRIVVEIDGWAFHSSARMFESDRRRDAVLAAAGLTVIRVTWRQLTTEPEAVLVRLAQALALGGRAVNGRDP